MLKKALIVVLVLLVLLQFYRPARNTAGSAQIHALKNKYPIPSNVDSALALACNDCHSNNTRYPWYAEVQPVNMYLTWHVNEGKRELNFDEFLSYPPKKQLKKIKEIIEVMEKKEMPLNSYTYLHQDAELPESQRNALINWAKDIKTQMEANSQAP